VAGVAIVAVVLADGAPLALTEVGSPLLPRSMGLPRVVQPILLDDVWSCAHVASLELTVSSARSGPTGSGRGARSIAANQDISPCPGRLSGQGRIRSSMVSGERSSNPMTVSAGITAAPPRRAVPAPAPPRTPMAAPLPP